MIDSAGQLLAFSAPATYPACPRRRVSQDGTDPRAPTWQQGDRVQVSTAPRQGGIVGKLSSPPATVELRILTQNTWCLPGILGTNRGPRLQGLGKAIRGYDIVGLQETFSDDCKILPQAGGYDNWVRQDRGGLLSINSGLTTLSGHPLTKWEFRPFKTCTGNEFLVRKGILFTRMWIKDFGCVDVYNTHFQAGGGRTAQEVRRDNIKELAAFIRENEAGRPTLLVGDFNLANESPEYQYLMEQLHPLDTYRQANPDQPGFTMAAGPRNPYNGKDEGNQRLDYVFVLPHPRYDVQIVSSQVVHDQPVNGTMLSDHFGVVTRLRLRRKD